MTEALSWFTPLPPARNGIADYAAMLLGEVAGLTPCTCYSEDPRAEAPEGVEVRDPLQAFRYLTPRSRILHQIGNNGGHVFALEALRRHGGVVSLHDLSLLYVYELATTKKEVIFGQMQAPAPALGEAYARHWSDKGLKTSANYVLFDMIGEILRRASAVIVHSDYASRKIRAMHGAVADGKIEVIPHFAKPTVPASSQAARESLGIVSDHPLILTSGFATKSKRFDWLIEALIHLRDEGRPFVWVHAGQERSEEYPLTDRIRDCGLSGISTVTGYLSEDELDAYIAAADVVVNLRFPSVGESSGTLARAFSAGRCCIVNDTAAYAEIPRDVVVHLPVFGTVRALVHALDHLIADRTLRETFGRRAQYYARTALSLDTIARRYLKVIEAARPAPDSARPLPGVSSSEAKPIRVSIEADRGVPDLSTALAPGTGPFELTLWFASAETLAAAAMDEPALVASALGPHVEVESVRFVQGHAARREGATDRIGLLVAGSAFG